MTIVNVQEAKGQLSRLIAAAERGDDVVIARAGTPVVRLTPIGSLPPRRLGFLAGLTVPDTFFEPMPEEELRGWEGGA